MGYDDIQQKLTTMTADISLSRERKQAIWANIQREAIVRERIDRRRSSGVSQQWFAGIAAAVLVVASVAIASTEWLHRRGTTTAVNPSHQQVPAGVVFEYRGHSNHWVVILRESSVQQKETDSLLITYKGDGGPAPAEVQCTVTPRKADSQSYRAALHGGQAELALQSPVNAVQFAAVGEQTFGVNLKWNGKTETLDLSYAGK